MKKIYPQLALGFILGHSLSLSYACKRILEDQESPVLTKKIKTIVIEDSATVGFTQYYNNQLLEIWILILNCLSQNDLLRLGPTSIPIQKATRIVWQNRFLDLSNRSLADQDYKAIQNGNFFNVNLNTVNFNLTHMMILEKCITLQKLYLYNNEINNEMVKHLSSLINLKELDLGCNEDIDAIGLCYLSPLTNLTYLNLSRNLIGNTGVQAISYLTNLEKLNLSCNEIEGESLHHIFSLKNLTSLNLFNNKGSSLSIQNISHLTNLRELDLSCNEIEGKGLDSLFPLTNLTYLYLFNNEIDDVSNLSYLTNLKELDLSYTDVNNIIFLLSLTNLTSLYLNSIEVANTDFQDLSFLTNLINLSLSNHLISNTDIQTISYLTNLKELNLSDNLIGTKGTQAISHLTNLKTLILQENEIDDLIYLFPLVNLTSLNLDNNPIDKVDIQNLYYIRNLIM